MPCTDSHLITLPYWPIMSLNLASCTTRLASTHVPWGHAQRQTLHTFIHAMLYCTLTPWSEWEKQKLQTIPSDLDPDPIPTFDHGPDIATLLIHMQTAKDSS